MGTVNYMSPEQAQAHIVDVRTDIWSTGVMIYEMVSGVQPFKGATVSHTIVQILEKDPLPLTQLTQRNAPEELQRIVAKALAKSPDERYQTAKDMLIDLRSLKKRLDVEAEIHRTSSQETSIATVSLEIDRAPQKKRVVVLAVIAMAVVTAGIFGFSLWRSLRAKVDVPVATLPAAPVPVEERTLTYWITVQKYRNGKPFQQQFTLSGEMIFEADYRIRLNIRSPQSGYLYVLNEGPQEATSPPEFVLLFPSTTANNGSPVVNAEQVITIPEKSWIFFDTQQGTEKLWFIFSKEAVPELELPGAANPQTRGLVKDAAQNRTIQNFLTTHAAHKPEYEKGDKQTTLKLAGKLLVYSLKLEHY
jgi:serine/threonine protein kinase